jgi:hypothetical protein
MPHDEWGNYYEQSFLASLFTGLVVVLALAVILSIPGWIAAAVWGWTWFFPGASMFWLGAMGVTVIIVTLYAIGSPD